MRANKNLSPVPARIITNSNNFISICAFRFCISFHHFRFVSLVDDLNLILIVPPVITLLDKIIL